MLGTKCAYKTTFGNQWEEEKEIHHLSSNWLSSFATDFDGFDKNELRIQR